MSDATRLVVFVIVVLVFVFILSLMGIFMYGMNLKDSASVIIGGAIGALFGILLEAVAFHRY
jgi:flagellar basal body-associated protein FliL